MKDRKAGKLNEGDEFKVISRNQTNHPQSALVTERIHSEKQPGNDSVLAKLRSGKTISISVNTRVRKLPTDGFE